MPIRHLGTCFRVREKGRCLHMLTEANPKKEFMNTMFLEGVRQHRKNNGEETRSLQIPWMNAKKAMNLN